MDVRDDSQGDFVDRFTSILAVIAISTSVPQASDKYRSPTDNYIYALNDARGSFVLDVSEVVDDGIQIWFETLVGWLPTPVGVERDQENEPE